METTIFLDKKKSNTINYVYTTFYNPLKCILLSSYYIYLLIPTIRNSKYQYFLHRK